MVVLLFLVLGFGFALVALALGLALVVLFLLLAAPNLSMLAIDLAAPVVSPKSDGSSTKAPRWATGMRWYSYATLWGTAILSIVALCDRDLGIGSMYSMVAKRCGDGSGLVQRDRHEL